MKFKFRMQKILEHRKNMESLAFSEYQEALLVKKNEEEKLKYMIEQKKQCRKTVFDFQTNEESPAITQNFIFTQSQAFQDLQDIRIEAQRKVILECEKEVESKLEILKIKAIEHKIIDKYKDKKAMVHAEEEKKQEHKEIDEIVTQRFSLGKTK